MVAFVSLAAVLLLLGALWQRLRAAARDLDRFGEAAIRLARGEAAELSIGGRGAAARFAERFNAMAAALAEREALIFQAGLAGAGSARSAMPLDVASLARGAQARRVLEADLRAAIAGGQFELHFQPLFDLSTSRIGSFEALLRWRHPTRGIVSPADFLPIAEESGLIVEIGGWSLREACAHAAAWPEHIRVAVNVSPLQVRHPALAETVLQALAASRLDPSRLELEVTEAALAEGPEASNALQRLQALGVRIALDDFGTGPTSLTCLQEFPFDRIKIDRSFIHQLLTRPGATAVLRAITGLAGALGMETTAEGVEESDQLAELRRHGCSSVQGYLFSRPIAPRDVLALLADEDSDRMARAG
ncbi:EAL domain-containing protein [Sphingomonas sp.]|uniref:putative bifunctional diguanylate cyclase/phosphodiesterase n=1 Tax=Sphingomonas sp. TaxID=28214 RepID=UPI001B00BE69|nr:EAL domain-containing protein [Sphingomonas sp.]MBO9712801.1 EAL domain-containing protein [Sphingomonas sp.]